MMRVFLLIQYLLVSCIINGYSSLSFAQSPFVSSKMRAVSCSILLKYAGKRPTTFVFSVGEYQYRFQFKTRSYAIAGEQLTRLNFEQGNMRVTISFDRPVKGGEPEFNEHAMKQLYEALSRYTKFYLRIDHVAGQFVKLHFYYRIDRQHASAQLKPILVDPRYRSFLNEFTYPDLDARFVVGSWDALLNGEHVKIELTNRGSLALQRYFTQFATKYVQPMLDLFFNTPTTYRTTMIKFKPLAPISDINNERYSFKVSGRRDSLTIRQIGSITFNMRTPFTYENLGKVH